MERVVIKATKRDVTGKKVSQLRREGKMPGVVYGHHIEPIAIVMDAREVTRAMIGLTPSSIVTELTDGEEGELWACVVNGYGAENEVLFTGKLFAANAEPQESLDSTENKIGITAEMILEAAMQLITSAMNQNQSYPTPSQDLP